MKKKLGFFALLLCLVLSLATLTSCSISDILGGGGGGGNVDDPDDPVWKPTGEKITLITKGEPGKYAVVYQDGDEIAHEAAKTLKKSLKELGLETAGISVMTTNVSEGRNEIIVGPSERQVSIDAMKLLEEKMAKSDDDFHCVFHYADGKLAIVANNKSGYDYAFDEFFDNYYENGSIAFLDGELTGEEMSHLTTLLQKPESVSGAAQALGDYIRIIREEKQKRDGTGGMDPLAAAMDKFKEKKGYGGKRNE